MRINNNLMAINAHRQLKINVFEQQKTLEKLSSGFRINRAGDDAAGLAISEKMRGQIRGLNQASRNAQDGISLIQTTEGAMNETHAILQRMRELAVQSANDTYVTEDRNNLQAEVAQLIQEVNRIATTTEFNTKKVLNGTFTDQVFHIGANAGQSITVSIGSISSTTLGIDAVNISTQTGADTAIGLVDTALNTVSTARANLGAIQNRLEHTIKNLDVAAENLQASESRIRDVDMAKEMVEFTKANILNQAATAMLAQANQTPQTVLQLLR
jgi:flagellin